MKSLRAASLRSTSANVPSLRKQIAKPKRLRRPGNLNTAISVVSIVIAVLSLVVGFRPSASDAKSGTETVRIVTDDDSIDIPAPGRPVARGERLSNVPIVRMKWPKSKVSLQYVSDIAEFKDAVARTTLPQMLPIPVSALSLTPIENNGVIEAIPQGMRAITVRVDAESAVEGWAQSGSFIDVILVRKPGGVDGDRLETKIIAENVRILSAGRSAEPSPADQTAPKTPSTVTLLTTQEDALKIKAAANLGKLTFALRGNGDQGPTTSLSLDERGLFGAAKLASPKLDYLGMARGPDGQTYVLDQTSNWLPAAESITSRRLGIRSEPDMRPEKAKSIAVER